MTGALKWDSMVEVFDSVIKVLGRAGFDPPDAVAAFDTVGRYAVGAAVHRIREIGAMKEGRSTLAELHATIATRPGELSGVRAFLAKPPIPTGHEFDDRLTTVLVGIALRRGEDTAAILERAALATHHLDVIGDEVREEPLNV